MAGGRVLIDTLDDDFGGGALSVGEIFDYIRDIKDPEHPYTLEQLNVVREDLITLREGDVGSVPHIRLEFAPTVPHCSLATLIGLCLRTKLERSISTAFKLDIFVKAGTHAEESDVNKQVNDKERIAAAMENPKLRDAVEQCLRDVAY